MTTSSLNSLAASSIVDDRIEQAQQRRRETAALRAEDRRDFAIVLRYAGSLLIVAVAIATSGAGTAYWVAAPLAGTAVAAVAIATWAAFVRHHLPRHG